MGRKADTYGRDFGGPTVPRYLSAAAGVVTARYGSLLIPQGLQGENAQLTTGEGLEDGAYFGGSADRMPPALFDLAWNVKELRWDYSFSSTAGTATGSRVLRRGQTLVIDLDGERYDGTATTEAMMVRHTAAGGRERDEWGADITIYGEEDTELSNVTFSLFAVPFWHYLSAETGNELGWWLDLSGSIALTDTGTSTAVLGSIAGALDSGMTVLADGVARFSQGFGPTVTGTMSVTVESRFSDWEIPV